MLVRMEEEEVKVMAVEEKAVMDILVVAVIMAMQKEEMVATPTIKNQINNHKDQEDMETMALEEEVRRWKKEW